MGNKRPTRKKRPADRYSILKKRLGTIGGFIFCVFVGILAGTSTHWWEWAVLALVMVCFVLQIKAVVLTPVTDSEGKSSRGGLSDNHKSGDFFKNIKNNFKKHGNRKSHKSDRNKEFSFKENDDKGEESYEENPEEYQEKTEFVVPDESEESDSEDENSEDGIEESEAIESIEDFKDPGDAEDSALSEN